MTSESSQSIADRSQCLIVRREIALQEHELEDATE